MLIVQKKNVNVMLLDSDYNIVINNFLFGLLKSKYLLIVVKV